MYSRWRDWVIVGVYFNLNFIGAFRFSGVFIGTNDFHHRMYLFGSWHISRNYSRISCRQNGSGEGDKKLNIEVQEVSEVQFVQEVEDILGFKNLNLFKRKDSIN